MKRIVVVKPYSCLLFGEGGRESGFLKGIVELDNFHFHTSNWAVRCDNASGSSPEIVLEKCVKAIKSYDFDLVICFIDLDVLIYKYPGTWKKERDKLERIYCSPEFKIFWQEKNAEDEFRKVLKINIKSKQKVNTIARKRVKDFIGSVYYKKIIRLIEMRESELK